MIKPRDLNQRVAWIVRQKRQMLGKKQEAVAEALGITQSTYQRMETGQSSMYLHQFVAVCGELALDPRVVMKSVLS